MSIILIPPSELDRFDAFSSDSWELASGSNDPQLRYAVDLFDFINAYVPGRFTLLATSEQAHILVPAAIWSRYQRQKP